MFQAAERHPGRTFAAVGLLFAAAYTAAMLSRGSEARVMNGDAVQYYAYLRSGILDRDFDFTNDYAELYDATPASSVWLRERTPAGRPPNLMSIGPALLWAPAFLVVLAIGAVLNGLGAGVPVDGYAAAYPISAGLAGIGYATVGAYLCYRVAALRWSQRAAFWAALVAWVASSSLYYSLVSPAYSHAVSVFTVSLFVFTWMRTLGDRRTTRFVWLGALAGLAMLVRWQTAICLLLPVLELVMAPGTTPVRIRALLRDTTIATATALVVFLPQLAAWRAIYGAWFVLPQGPGFMQWSDPAIASVLFSARRGLFIWTPAMLAAVIGLVWVVRRDRLLGLGALAMLAIDLYINAAAFDWWAGEAFGARRFVGDQVYFTIGLAALGTILATRMSRGWLRGAALALIVANGLLLLQYQLALRGRADVAPYPTTYRRVLIDRFIVPWRLLSTRF
jgi:hypothetical protein